jgi:hypothetical protein
VKYQVDYLLSKNLPAFSNVVKIPFFAFFDLVDFLRFGRSAPRKYELLYVKTQDVERGYKTPRPHHLGVVRNKYWDLDLVDVDQACGGKPGIARHRVEADVPWEKSGELERVIEYRRREGKSDTPEDSDFKAHWNRRYSQLDVLIDEVRATGRLRTMAEFLTTRRFRERGGIGVSIDGWGRLILTEGHHRFGIMKGLRIEAIPVTLYAIHPQFMKTHDWRAHLNRLRKDGY